MAEITYKDPDWLNEGQIVFVDCRMAGIYGQKEGTGLRCKVEAAHGDAGLLVNEKYGFRKLVSRWDMWEDRRMFFIKNRKGKFARSESGFGWTWIKDIAWATGIFGKEEADKIARQELKLRKFELVKP